MKFKLTTLALLLAGLLWLASSPPSYAQEGIVVTATAYSCERHPNNPMRCGNPRWGGSINSPGMACPVAWKNRYYEVPGYGVRRCDDTGAYDYFYGRPHIDIRLSSYAAAAGFGVRRMVIYPASSTASTTLPAVNDGPGEEAATVAPPPAIPASDSREGALYRAMQVEPMGDQETAHVTWLRLGTARDYFPSLVSKVAGGDDRAVWAVLLWVPPSSYPTWTQAVPTPSQGVAGRFMLFDVGTGDLLASHYVSPDVTATMGWLPDDPH